MPIGSAMVRIFSAVTPSLYRLSAKKFRYLNTARLPSSSTTDSTRKKRLRFLLSANRSIARPQSHAASVDASTRKMYFGSPHE